MLSHINSVHLPSEGTMSSNFADWELIPYVRRQEHFNTFEAFASSRHDDNNWFLAQSLMYPSSHIPKADDIPTGHGDPPISKEELSEIIAKQRCEHKELLSRSVSSESVDSPLTPVRIPSMRPNKGPWIPEYVHRHQ